MGQFTPHMMSISVFSRLLGIMAQLRKKTQTNKPKANKQTNKKPNHVQTIATFGKIVMPLVMENDW